MAAPVAARPRAARLAVPILRLAGAALLVANAVIHGRLWAAGYRTIPTVGWLFLLGTMAAAALAALVVAAPRRWLAPVALLGALLEAGTVFGLYLATVHSLFAFTESSKATYYWQSAITELFGTVVLTVLTAVSVRPMRSRVTRPWW